MSPIAFGIDAGGPAFIAEVDGEVARRFPLELIHDAVITDEHGPISVRAARTPNELELVLAARTLGTVE